MSSRAQRLAILAFVLCSSGRALAIDFMFAGSGALDYAAFIGAHTHTLPQPSSIGLDSMTLELSQKVVIDVSKNINVNVKVCYGCHGVELDQGYGEVHLRDWFSLRAGRINVPIGEFNMRHDPANYNTPSKPLPFAMGDMLHYGASEFNLGVLPTPYSDNGVEVFGTFFVARKVLIDYSLHLVRGFVGANDLNFIDSRQWVAPKHVPSLGGRVVATVGPVSVGGSVAWGYYDANQKLTYLFYGTDAYARWGPLVFRGEFIARHTDYDPNAPGYLFRPKEHYFVKAGYYAQLDYTPRDFITLVARIDGLVRRGMPLPNSAILQDDAEIVRGTAGLAVRFASNFVVKGDYEYWHFSGVSFEDQHVARAELLFSY